MVLSASYVCSPKCTWYCMTISRNFHPEPWNHPERGNSEISSVWRLHWTTLNLLSSWRYSLICACVRKFWISKHLLCQREYSVLQSHLPLAIFIHVCGRYVQEKEAQHDVRDALQATGWSGRTSPEFLGPSPIASLQRRPVVAVFPITNRTSI